MSGAGSPGASHVEGYMSEYDPQRLFREGRESTRSSSEARDDDLPVHLSRFLEVSGGGDRQPRRSVGEEGVFPEAPSGCGLHPSTARTFVHFTAKLGDGFVPLAPPPSGVVERRRSSYRSSSGPACPASGSPRLRPGSLGNPSREEAAGGDSSGAAREPGSGPSARSVGGLDRETPGLNEGERWAGESPGEKPEEVGAGGSLPDTPSPGRKPRSSDTRFCRGEGVDESAAPSVVGRAPCATLPPGSEGPGRACRSYGKGRRSVKGTSAEPSRLGNGTMDGENASRDGVTETKEAEETQGGRHQRSRLGHPSRPRDHCIDCAGDVHPSELSVGRCFRRNDGVRGEISPAWQARDLPEHRDARADAGSVSGITLVSAPCAPGKGPEGSVGRGRGRGLHGRGGRPISALFPRPAGSWDGSGAAGMPSTPRAPGGCENPGQRRVAAGDVPVYAPSSRGPGTPASRVVPPLQEEIPAEYGCPRVQAAVPGSEGEADHSGDGVEVAGGGFPVGHDDGGGVARLSPGIGGAGAQEMRICFPVERMGGGVPREEGFCSGEEALERDVPTPAAVRDAVVVPGAGDGSGGVSGGATRIRSSPTRVTGRVVFGGRRGSALDAEGRAGGLWPGGATIIRRVASVLGLRARRASGGGACVGPGDEGALVEEDKSAASTKSRESWALRPGPRPVRSVRGAEACLRSFRGVSPLCWKSIGGVVVAASAPGKNVTR